MGDQVSESGNRSGASSPELVVRHRSKRQSSITSSRESSRSPPRSSKHSSTRERSGSRKAGSSPNRSDDRRSKRHRSASKDHSPSRHRKRSRSRDMTDSKSDRKNKPSDRSRSRDRDRDRERTKYRRVSRSRSRSRSSDSRRRRSERKSRRNDRSRSPYSRRHRSRSRSRSRDDSPHRRGHRRSTKSDDTPSTTRQPNKKYDFLIGSEASSLSDKDNTSSSSSVSRSKRSDDRSRSRDRGRDRDRDRIRDRDRSRDRDRRRHRRSPSYSRSRSRSRSPYRSSYSSKHHRSGRGRSRSPHRDAPDAPFFPLKTTNEPVIEVDVSQKTCPFQIIAGSPKSQYAWVLLIFGGASYVPGILSAAHSLRLSKTAADIVCLVTEDVNDQACADIARTCDVVIRVPYVSVPSLPMRTDNQKSMYGTWNDRSFTKWTSLGLVMYEKVCFFDADKIALQNMDDLFEMQTPAGTFGSSWGKCVDTDVTDPDGKRRKMLKIYKDAHGKSISTYKGGRHMDWVSSQVGYDVSLGFVTNNQGMNNPYWGVSHGEIVHPDLIYYGLNKDSFVAVGTMILLSPNLKDYEEFKDMIANDPICSPNNVFGFKTCYSGKDEQSIAYFYMRKGVPWRFIDARYNCIPWLSKWLMYTSEINVPRLYHYFNIKPWVFDRDEYADLEVWWAIVRHLITVFAGAAPPLLHYQPKSADTMADADAAADKTNVMSSSEEEAKIDNKTDVEVPLDTTSGEYIPPADLFSKFVESNLSSSITETTNETWISFPLSKYFDPIHLVKPLKIHCSWCKIMKQPEEVYSTHSTMNDACEVTCPDIRDRKTRLLRDFGLKLQ